jgi:indole-3-glycerol phosphate synthase
MSTFLSKILSTKADEVRELLTASLPPIHLPSLPPTRGFAKHIRSKANLAVVAEIKKASPSKGLIAPDFRPVTQAKLYEAAGAAAISVLTDKTYFQGSLIDLQNVHQAVTIPILRKDFIIHEIQIHEARLSGADAILLICAALSPERLKALSDYAKSLGLDVLIEVHQQDEMGPALSAAPTVLGINNRNLHTFEVSLDVTRELCQSLHADMLVISESGIFTAEDAEYVAQAGVSGILVGESLMKQGSHQVEQALQALQVPKQQISWNAAVGQRRV